MTFVFFITETKEPTRSQCDGTLTAMKTIWGTNASS